MTNPEALPISDYDRLRDKEITDRLSGRKFGKRQQVLEEVARLLPSARASAGEDRAEEERKARVRDGFAHLDKTAPDRGE